MQYAACAQRPAERFWRGDAEWTEQRCSASVSVIIQKSDTYTAIVSNGGADDLSFDMQTTHTDGGGNATRVADADAGGRAQRRRTELWKKLGLTAPDGPVTPGAPLDQLGLGTARASRRGGARPAPPGRAYTPDGPSSPAPLKPPTTDELIAGAETDFRYGRAEKAISTSLELLKKNPDHPRLNLLLGKAYYAAKDYERCVSFLAKAVALGEKVSFPVAHHRKVFAGRSDNGPDNDLSASELSLQKDSIELRRTSETTRTGVRVSDEGFVAPLTKIYELKYEPDKDEKLKLEVGIPQLDKGASKEKRRTYNLYPPEAKVEYSEKKLLSLSKTQIRCASCSAATKVIHSLLLSLRK